MKFLTMILFLSSATLFASGEPEEAEDTHCVESASADMPSTIGSLVVSWTDKGYDCSVYNSAFFGGISIDCDAPVASEEGNQFFYIQEKCDDADEGEDNADSKEDDAGTDEEDDGNAEA